MKTLITTSLALVLGVALCAQSSDMKAMAQQFGQSAKANAAALRMYSWQMRVEVTLKGDAKPAKLYAMRFDPNGVPQKTLLNPAPPAEPTRGLKGKIKEKKIAEFKEWAGDLVDLCKGYLIPSPALLQAFFERVLTTPAPGGFVQLYAEGVISPGDKLTLRDRSEDPGAQSRAVPFHARRRPDRRHGPIRQRAGRRAQLRRDDDGQRTEKEVDGEDRELPVREAVAHETRSSRNPQPSPADAQPARVGRRITRRPLPKSAAPARGEGSRLPWTAAGRAPARRRAAPPRHLSAADRQLGGPEGHGHLRGDRPTRRPGASKAALGTIKAESATSVSTAQRLVSLAESPDHRVELLHAPAGPGPDGGRGDPGRRAARRSRASPSIACSPTSTRARSSRRTWTA